MVPEPATNRYSLRRSGATTSEFTIKIRPSFTFLATLEANIIELEYIRKGQSICDPPDAVALVKNLRHFEPAAQVPKKTVADADFRAYIESGA
jgi:hypothetical protein